MKHDYKTEAWLWLAGSIVVVWLAMLFASSYEEGHKLIEMLESMTVSLQIPFSIKWSDHTLKITAIFLFIYAMGIGFYYATRENRRPGVEHGSAKWGNVQRIVKRYKNHKQESQNLILSENMRLGLDGKKHRRNLNVLVVGGSGSGKTRFYAKPNIMQCNTSFIITDPKAEILRATSPLLIEKGYDIKVFNLINTSQSDGYNPFAYLNDEMDVIKLITNLIRNTTPKNATQGEPFWERAEIALDTALILYLMDKAPPEEQNFDTVMYMIENGAASEEDETYKSPLDLLFDSLREKEPNHIALRQYNIFKQAAGKTAKSILISAAVRLAAFQLPEISRITSYDSLDLGSTGERKKAIFCVIPDNDSSFNYLVGMLYTQAFQEIFYCADHKYGGELPIPVHLMMDEFANVSLPENFETSLATMRSRRVSVSIIIQNMAQLKALFKNSWESIVGNCDTMIYLGGNEQATHEYISKMLGKETIDTRTRGITKGRQGSSNTNYQNTGRELLTLDEVRLLDNQNSLIFLRGERAMMDKKFEILKHPNIGYTLDGGGTPYHHNIDKGYVRKDIDTKNIENIEIIEGLEEQYDEKN
ncbi:MAG: type IV secretory system conjugative DNA transfer family protein [Clostridiaceae bacterium]|nr:type IV secretory system conjugative DNA transfer family protein [Clostridiaceae bacterium]